MNNIINELEKTIDKKLYLRRDKRDWLIPAKTDIRVRSPHRHSMGFSLDAPRQKPLAFFSSQPSTHLAKICDALIAVVHEDKLYLFAIEAKSGNKDDYRKQLANGRHFWHWLIALYKEHRYLPLKSKPLYMAVLIWKPREKQVRKGPTTHQGNAGIEIVGKQKGFDARFEVQNRDKFSLHELIKELPQQSMSNKSWPKRKATPRR